VDGVVLGMMRLQAIVFDLDGTLADTLPIIFGAIRHAATGRTTGDLSDAGIFARFGPIEYKMLESYIGTVSEKDWSDFLSRYDALHGARLEPFAGLPEVVSQAREWGLKVAMVTGKGPDTAAISLRRMGLEGAFHPVVAGNNESRGKVPLLQLALAQLALPPGATAYLGDSPLDVVHAREVGMRALAAAWAPTAKPAEQLARQPEAQFATVEEFGQWLAAEAHRPKSLVASLDSSIP